MATLSALKFNSVDGADQALSLLESLQKQHLSREQEDRLRAEFGEE